MATIKEMALQEFPCIKKEDNSNFICGYVRGANAVLKEIVDIISVGCDDVHFEEILKCKIKELKGE